MTITARLRVAFGAYVVLLAASLVFLVHSTRRSLDTGGALREIDALLREAAAVTTPVDVRASSDSLAHLQSRLREQLIATRVLREASQLAMHREVERADRAARVTVATAWAITAGALLIAAVLAALLGKLDQLERLKKELVSNVSHDLKTPLSSIQEANAAMLDGLAGPVTDAQRRLLAHNRESARRLASMVAKLLELSRLESRVTPSFTRVDLVEVVRAAVARASAVQQGVVVFSSTVREAVVLGERQDLERVLDNLIENAIKFSPPCGTVRVVLSAAPNGRACITVADEGPGIPDIDKQRVFERFYQTDVGRAVRARGMGLGLSICRRIIQEHHGHISVSDNAPCGTIVGVVLPLAMKTQALAA